MKSTQHPPAPRAFFSGLSLNTAVHRCPRSVRFVRDPVDGDLQAQGKPRKWVNPAKSNKTVHPPRRTREPGPAPKRPGFHPPGQEPAHWATERSPMIWNTLGYHASTLGHDVMYAHQGPQWVKPSPMTPPAVGRSEGRRGVGRPVRSRVRLELPSHLRFWFLAFGLPNEGRLRSWSVL